MPSIPGLRLQVHEGSNWLVLTNRTSHDVTILGYLGEPYFRLGPSGAYENADSPSLYLAQTGPANGASSTTAKRYAPVRWLRIRNGPALGWHDHRVHWAIPILPPEVQRNPSVSHVVIPGWHIPLRWNGQPVVVTGNVIWKPGPSPWPWVGVAVLAVLAAGVVAALGWPSRRSRPVVACAILVGVGSDLVWAVDRWTASYVSVFNKLDALLAVFGAVTFAVIALALMARGGGGRGMLAAVFTGVCLICDFQPENGVWRFSDIPTSLSAGAVRLLAVVTLSCGVGLVAVGWHQAVWVLDQAPSALDDCITEKPASTAPVHADGTKPVPWSSSSGHGTAWQEYR